ncbi:MAG TPA: hypothetical protein VIV60_36885 [Polyangiaceae bacterium]
MRHPGAIAPLALLLLNGCQYVSGVAELNIGADKVAATPWDCLGVGKRDDPKPRPTVEYVGSVWNISGTSVLADVVLRLCQTTDESCSAPVLSVASVDSVIRFTVDSSFAGYVELESPGMMPAVVELSRPIGSMRTLPEFRMLDVFTLELFALNMGKRIDASLGHALYWTEDCSGSRAPGVSVKALGDLTDETAQYYVVDRKLPSASVTMTDASGGGGFINLPITYVTFEAFRADTKQTISTFPGRIRPGQVTFMVVEPD